jgi:hypothetical protein
MCIVDVAHISNSLSHEHVVPCMYKYAMMLHAHHYHYNYIFLFCFVKSYWSGWCWCRPCPARWPIPTSYQSGTRTTPGPARPRRGQWGHPIVSAMACQAWMHSFFVCFTSNLHAILEDPFRTRSTILVSLHFYHPSAYVYWYSSLVQLISFHLKTVACT